MNAEAGEPYHPSSTFFRRRASHPACGPRKGEAHRPFRAKAAFSDASSATSSAWFGFQSRRESRSPESKKAGIRAESIEPVWTSQSPITGWFAAVAVGGRHVFSRQRHEPQGDVDRVDVLHGVRACQFFCQAPA